MRRTQDVRHLLFYYSMGLGRRHRHQSITVVTASSRRSRIFIDPFTQTQPHIPSIVCISSHGMFLFVFLFLLESSQTKKKRCSSSRTSFHSPYSKYWHKLKKLWHYPVYPRRQSFSTCAKFFNNLCQYLDFSSTLSTKNSFFWLFFVSCGEKRNSVLESKSSSRKKVSFPRIWVVVLSRSALPIANPPSAFGKQLPE